jgi:DNA-binding response OmpR family regulator
MLKGYELGAEDYVTKPFPMSVFQKKLAVVLGRLTKQYGGDTYEDRRGAEMNVRKLSINKACIFLAVLLRRQACHKAAGFSFPEK